MYSVSYFGYFSHVQINLSSTFYTVVSQSISSNLGKLQISLNCNYITQRVTSRKILEFSNLPGHAPVCTMHQSTCLLY